MLLRGLDCPPRPEERSLRKVHETFGVGPWMVTSDEHQSAEMMLSCCQMGRFAARQTRAIVFGIVDLLVFGHLILHSGGRV